VVGVNLQRLERQTDRHASVFVEFVGGEKFELPCTLVVQYTVQNLLQVLHDGDQYAYLDERIVVAHHRDGDGLYEPSLLLDGNEVGGDLPLQRTLSLSRCATVFLVSVLFCCHVVSVVQAP
jgi:hypothetical protein